MSKSAQVVIKSCNRRDLELDQLRNFLSGNGFEVSICEARQFVELKEMQIDRNADLIILSTCAFSTVTEKSSLSDLQLIEKLKKPTAEVLVCGCLPDINPQSLSQVFHGASFGPRSYDKLDAILHSDKKFEEFHHSNIATAYGPKTFTIQIHEGCPCNCSYCAIRFSVGSLKSKPFADVISEFSDGISKGFKKFILVGDCSGGFGLDINETLSSLLLRIAEFEEEFELSLTDIAPFHLPHAYEGIRKLCEQRRMTSLYVATQSANSRILGLMRRSFDMSRTREMMQELKRINPSLELTTSLIVGFPTETEAELADTIMFCHDSDFDIIFCHGYSGRPNIDSEKIGGLIEQAEIERRCMIVKSELGKRVKVVTIPGKGGVAYEENRLKVLLKRTRHKVSHLTWKLKEILTFS